MPEKKKKSRKARGRPGNPRIREIGQSTRFQVGQSGNPGGRPNFSEFSDAIRKVACMNVSTLKITPRDSVSLRIAKKLAREAMKGRVFAASLLMERAEGRAATASVFIRTGPKTETEVTMTTDSPEREAYVDAVKHALGFYADDQPRSVALLTDGKATAAPAGELYDQLIEIVRHSDNQEVATLAANLAMKMKKGTAIDVQPS